MQLWLFSATVACDILFNLLCPCAGYIYANSVKGVLIDSSILIKALCMYRIFFFQRYAEIVV